jgi:hypothetical protein
MKFRKGDKVNNIKEYFSQCISMEYLHRNLKIGDKFLTYRDTVNCKISEFEFFGFTYCKWLKAGTAGTCNTVCKGYLDLSNGRKMCPGYSKNNASCVLYIKKEYLEDKLFEI